MRRLIRIALVILVIGLIAVWLMRGTAPPEVAPGTALLVDLSGEYLEGPSPSLLARAFGAAGTPLAATLSELAKAERDDRLGAVVLRIGALDVGWAKAQELRDAILRLGEAGRRTVAYLEVERFGANLEYYVASAADEVWVAPGTRTPLVGLAAEYLFLGGLWEKLGIEIEVERIGRYKSAAEVYAGSEMSKAHREMANSLLDSIESQFLAAIAAGRDLSEDAVRRAIAEAPVTGEELQRHGLVDAIGFRDALLTTLGDPQTLEAERYAAVPLEAVGFQPVARFALVYGTGPVVVGEGQPGPAGRPFLASERVGDALREAAEDESIDAIVFRIDSPGGSALASDIVWKAVQEARARKPVIASMSDLAASGGYYVAAGADVIVAEPGTLTGSIGVFVLRPVLAGLLDKLGVHHEVLLRGEHAELLTGTRPLSGATRARLRREVESVYALFVERVADGRPLEPEGVDAVGQGRVWTGAQAAERGLVDSLGGLRTAVDAGRERLALDPDADVALVPYPPPASLGEQIRQALGGGVQLAERLPLPEPLAQLAAWLAPLPSHAPVLLPPISVRIR